LKSITNEKSARCRADGSNVLICSQRGGR